MSPESGSATPDDRASTRRAPGRKRRSRRRRILLRLAAVGGMVLLLAALASVVVLRSDLPRRWLESKLAADLDAGVELGSLELLGRGRYRLLDLRLRTPVAFPALHRLDIARIDAEASLGQLWRGELETVALYGSRAFLDPAAPAIGEGEEEAPVPRIGRLEARGIEIEMLDPATSSGASGPGNSGTGVSGAGISGTGTSGAGIPSSAGETAVLDLELRGLGGRLEGELAFRSPAMDLAPLLSFAGWPATPWRRERRGGESGDAIRGFSEEVR
ncbi:MAG: hypothetical protein MI919_22810, partial [Holophagales bacterium]|nr:hypothetical protein [Holophagales bacterium]